MNSASPSTSPEEATNIQQQPVVADYPRPSSTPKDTDAKVDEEVLVGDDGPAATAENEQGNGAGVGGSNRKERRRQERKKDKYQTEEDKMHHDMQQQKSELPFDHKSSNKDARGGAEKSNTKRAPSASAGGPRITQPVSRFMA